ncbi:MAG: biopolymer transporter ExbD [Gammaproteobacteria bacterium]|nr:biopolymer transporter ExbD [Gammaproteobacteria bacterium]MDH5652778.1 biopolymer transporter ExbD [Gammaproteobacteria bacterium]
MKKFAKRRLHDVEELNITAFMNLMVILVPFLLITAVFSRMTILELNLPPANAKPAEVKEEKFSLEVVLRENSFDVYTTTITPKDTVSVLVKKFERNKLYTDWKAFSDLMVQIKARLPAEDSITLLLEPGIDYKTLIQVMDRVRSADILNVVTVETHELFPNISIGDAPELVSGEAGKAK